MGRYLLLLTMAAIVLGGCGREMPAPGDSAQNALPRNSAPETVRVPIIELALRGSGDANAINSEHTQIYVAQVSRNELDAWLTGSDARAAAQQEGRPVDEVEAEWQDAGIRSVPELDGGQNVWIVDIRGIRHTPPAMFSSDPRDWDPSATAAPEEPFVYDNFHMIFNAQGAGMGSGAFVDAAATPPLGIRVPLDRIYETPYVLEVPVNAMPTAPAPAALPTSTPVR